MTKDQANREGYSYTGIYKRNKEEAKARAQEERKKGNRAVVVGERDSIYSRSYQSGIIGYSVMVKVSEANKAAASAQHQANIRARLQRAVDKAKEDLVAAEQALANFDTPKV